jgi:CRISPR/Cas system CSM-associated protein Csm3 (group 7 of RAMP superfamily)
MRWITVLHAEIMSQSPLFIGDGSDLFLKDEETGRAYLPATSIAGAFRAYLKGIGEKDWELFGEQANDRGLGMSKVYINDAYADIKGKDRRIGIRIDPEKGSSIDKSKRDMCYLSPGLKFELVFEIHEDKNNDELLRMLCKCLSGLEKGYVRFGGSKSSGLGIFKIVKAGKVSFDLNCRQEWLKFLCDDYSVYNVESADFLKEIKSLNLEGYVEFKIHGRFTTPVLIKSPESAEDEDADYKNVKSGDRFIIPGSSFKGILKSRMEKIADYFRIENEVKELFGESSSKGYPKDTNDEIHSEEFEEEKKENKKAKHSLSRIFVEEAVIDGIKKAENNSFRRYNKIRIDKFAGGVMNTALMGEIPVQGNTNFNVLYKKSGNDEKDNFTVGLITLALRDLGTENLAVGGGSSTGRGRFKASKMSISDDNDLIEIDFNNKAILSNKDILHKYVEAVINYAGKEENSK